MKKSIETAFLETNYIVYLKTDLVLRIGEDGKNLLSQLGHLKSWAFVTAWNPLPEVLSLEENEIRNETMKKQLLGDGYSFWPATGISKDGNWSETSILIENISLKAAHRISAQFGQLAFLYGDLFEGNQLVFTSKNQ